ncbi:MAG: hypothetical protein GY929_05350 [Actinomycetia bacterium]|nr:hypothetical protein [Actinomycetes bacterium]
MVDEEVVLGPGFSSVTGDEQPHDVVVLASGNLGLVSFPAIPGRASFEVLANRYPGLILGLAQHPGVGFVLVRSEMLGPLAIGSHGVHYLADGRAEGLDPLEPFGPNTGDHLRRTDSFRNTPDLLVNSFYDPDIDEGAAFEELIGFHGGLGGKQTEPFILYPSTFPIDDTPIVGATPVYRLFKGWLAAASEGALPPPWEATKRDPSLGPPTIPITQRHDDKDGLSS